MGLQRRLVLPARASAAVLIIGASAALAAPARAAEGWSGGVVRFEPVRSSTTGFSADTGPGHRGAMELRPGGALIVEIRLDDYVHGIQEVPSSWPGAAQRAQAIASRTYAVNRVIAARRAASWKPGAVDICATEQCQVYTGIASERRASGAAWQAAAKATSGHVMLHEGQPILAKYSASNGGRSVSGGSPTLPSVDDPDDTSSPHHRWSQRLQPAPLARVIGSSGAVVAARRDGDTSILTVDEGGVQRDIQLGANDLYNKVNAALPKNGLPRVFPSDRYSLSFRDGQVIADGNGYGHGVGLAQWGSYGKAQRGLDHPAILSSYYGPSKLAALPASAPQTVRVGLAAVRDAAVRPIAVGGAPAGNFRVKVDGRVVAVSGGGTWRVSTTGGVVRVVPPVGWQSAPDGPDEDAPRAAALPSAAAAPATTAPTTVPPAPAPTEPPAPEVITVAAPVPETLAASAVVAERRPGVTPVPFFLVLGAAIALGGTGARLVVTSRRAR